MDDLGLHVPPMGCPSFNAKAKSHAGKLYADPSVPRGFLREVILADKKFDQQPIALQMWVVYLVAVHEVRKELGLEVAS